MPCPQCHHPCGVLVCGSHSPRYAEGMPDTTRDAISPPWDTGDTTSPHVPCMCPLLEATIPRGTGVGCAPHGSHWVGCSGQDVSLVMFRGMGAAGTVLCPGGVSDVPYWSHSICFSLALSADMRDRCGFSGHSHRAAPFADRCGGGGLMAWWGGTAAGHGAVGVPGGG